MQKPRIASQALATLSLAALMGGAAPALAATAPVQPTLTPASIRSVASNHTDYHLTANRHEGTVRAGSFSVTIPSSFTNIYWDTDGETGIVAAWYSSSFNTQLSMGQIELPGIGTVSSVTDLLGAIAPEDGIELLEGGPQSGVLGNGIPYALNMYGVYESGELTMKTYLLFATNNEVLFFVASTSGNPTEDLATVLAAMSVSVNSTDAISSTVSSSKSGSSQSSSSSSARTGSTQRLGAGCYEIGTDIPAGRYDIEAVSGSGNIWSYGSNGRLGLNEIMGTKSGYLSSYKGLKLEVGGELNISGDLVVKTTAH